MPESSRSYLDRLRCLCVLQNQGIGWRATGLPMSEHQESEDDLTLWMRELPSTKPWLEELQCRVDRLCDPENPLERERRRQELLNMAQG